MTVYEIITNDLIKTLEAGTVPWAKPWRGIGGMPINLKTKHVYRGINTWILNSAGYTSPYWISFKQALDLGGHVRAGEHGRRIVFWKIEKNREEGERDRCILRYSTVFNVAQCDGLDVPETVQAPPDPVAVADRIVEGYKNKPTIDWTGAGAWYRPSTDHVTMPPRGAFNSAGGLYGTLFHELAHSTGHESRLKRQTLLETAGFGSAIYGREELIAEMTSAYLLGHAGILDGQIDQSAAYLQGWIKALKGDSRLVVAAASGAQKAADYILGDGEGSDNVE